LGILIIFLLIYLLEEFEKIWIYRSNVNFVIFRRQSKNLTTITDPYVVNGEELFWIAEEKRDCDIIDEIKVGTFGRLFRNDNGRNQGADWLNFADFQHLFGEVDLEIANKW